MALLPAMANIGAAMAAANANYNAADYPTPAQNTAAEIAASTDGPMGVQSGTPGGNLIPMPGPTGNYLERSSPMMPAVGSQMPQNRLSAIPYDPYPNASILPSLAPTAGSLGDPNVQANPLVQQAMGNPQLQNALSQLVMDGGAGEPGLGDISNNPDTGQMSPAVAEAIGSIASQVPGFQGIGALLSLQALGVLPPGTPIGLDRNNPNPNIATNADIAAQLGLTGDLSSQGQSFDPTAFSDPVSQALGDLFGFDMSSTFGSDFGEFSGDIGNADAAGSVGTSPDAATADPGLGIDPDTAAGIQ